MNVNDFVKFLEENKLKSIAVYNLSENGEEKFVVLSSATSVIQSKKVADLIAEKFAYTDNIEGYSKGEWIVFDFGKVAIHMFLPKVREKYNLDKLYKTKRVVL